MINVSNEYLEKINSSSKQVDWFGRVTLKNGTVYDFDCSNLAQGQTSITKELSANKFGIGGTCSAELRIAFMLDYDADSNTYSLNNIIVNRYDFYEAEVELYFRLFLDDDNLTQYEDINLGTFIITDPERSRLVLTCVAYDYMQKFSKPCVSELQGSPYNTLLNACNICGVPLGNTIQEINHMVNGTKTIAEYDPKNQIRTWRDTIGYVAALLCGNAVIKNNKLYIVPYKAQIDRYVSSNDRVSLALEDYYLSYGSITTVNLRNNTEEKVEIDSSIMAYKMTANPLMQYTVNTARNEVLRNILTAINSLHVIPFKSELFCDPSYELGDTIVFSDNHAENGTKCIVTSIVIKVNEHMDITCEGDDPYLKQVEESADRTYSESTNGSIGDGVTFYDYISEDDVYIGDGEEEEIVSITYDSNGSYRQEFMSELKIGAVSTEVSSNDSYTENDIEVFVTYYINGQEVASYHPETWFTDGVSLLHLFYFWNSDIRIPESTFSATITVNGGAITVLEGNNHSRIMQSGTAYVEGSNVLEYIDVFKEPNKIVYKRGENIDFTGLIIRAYYSNGSFADITNQCTYNPINGSVATDRSYINVKATYVEDGKAYYADFGLEVMALSWIDVVADPTKLTYRVGDTLDFTGMVIYAYYDDNSYVDVTSGCVISPAEGTTITESMETILLNISYDDDGTELKTVYDKLELHKLIALDLAKDPTKTDYFVGDTLDLTGVQIKAEYSDDTEADVTASCTFSPADGSTLSQQGSVTVTASYTEDGVTKTCPIVLTVEKVMLDELSVVPPTKTTYFVGETLDLTGVHVTAIYNNYSTKDVTAACQYIPADGSTIEAGTAVLQIKYTEDGITLTETVDIEVITLDEIVVTPPTNVKYQVGETLDYSGVVVTAKYSNGFTKDVTAQSTFNPVNGSTASSSTNMVTVSYSENGVTLTDTFDLEIVEFEGIEVTHDPNKTEYLVGETIDLTGTVVMGNWSDGSQEDVTSECTFAPGQGDTTTSGMNQITVTYERSGQTYTDVISITVDEGEITLTDLRITTPPDVVDYYVGEELDLEGIVVTAYFSNGTTRNVTSECTYSPSEGTTLGLSSDEIVATYIYDNVTMTDSTPLYVRNVELKYFLYDVYVDAVNNYPPYTIVIYGVNQAEMEEDNLVTLKVPSTYYDEATGKTFTIIIR